MSEELGGAFGSGVKVETATIPSFVQKAGSRRRGLNHKCAHVLPGVKIWCFLAVKWQLVRLGNTYF